MTRFALLFAVAACGASEAPDLTPTLGPPLQDRENNGRFLLGADTLEGAGDGLDSLSETPDYFYSVASTSMRGTQQVTAYVEGITLVSSDGKSPQGLIFNAPVGTSQLQIAAELPATAAAPRRYLILHRTSQTAQWTDPCHGNAALPFAGRFTSNRHHVAQPGEISFGCDGAVAYKCAGLWGYLPSASDNPNFDDEWDVHEACTAMASSTYCMDGTSYTRNGSAIELMDDWGVSTPTPPNMSPPRPWRLWMLPANQWPPTLHTYYLEGGWYDEEAPLCLTRTRWASLPPDPCPAVLPDPRTTAGARYCEEYSNDELSMATALVWNNSLVNDLPLHTWRTGTDRLTTVRGFHDDFRSQPPKPGMVYESSGGILVRETTTEFTELGILDEVHMFCETALGTRCVVTTPRTAPASHSYDLGFEGYVFLDLPGRPSDTVPFYLYQKVSTGDYVSAISQPAGYGPGTFIGFVLE